MYKGKYRVAIIGHTGRGNYGHSLDLAFSGLPRVDVVAVADPDAHGRALAVGRTGAPRSYAEYQEMLARETPDVVAVCTRWPDQHVAMIGAAVEAGAHGIYCEKPLASSPDEADRILAACDGRNVKLTVSHHNRVRAAPRLAQRLIAEGAIGRLRTIKALGKCDQRGGGEDMLVLGSHLMDLMRRFAGDVRWCDAQVLSDGRMAGPADIGRAEKEDLGPLLGDDVRASYGFDAGVTATFESMRAAGSGERGYYHFELGGTAGIVSFLGTPGSPVWYLPQPFAVPGGATSWQVRDPGPLGPPVPDATPPPVDANQFFEGNRALAVDLLEAIEENRPTASDGHNAAAALEMIVAVYASHFAGQRVGLPLADRAHPLASPPQAALV
jgi:predicted dehydrogenase